MGNDLFRARLRKIGSSIGILIPKEELDALEVGVGDEVDVALLKHRSKEELAREIDAAFGVAKGAGPFVRDKRSREF